MDVIWITPKWPFPVTDGARIATTQLLKNLTAQGMKVHLCALVPENEQVDITEAKRELGVIDVTVIQRKNRSRIQLLFALVANPFFPVTLSPYASDDVARKVSKVIGLKKVELIVYDGLHAAAWRWSESVRRDALNQKIPEAYRAHNVESEIWFRGASETSNFFKKVFLYLQGFLVKKIETKLVRESRFVFPVSLADEEKFRLHLFGAKIMTLPIGMQIDSALRLPKADNRKRKILFVGKLDWAPNREGLLWILKNVWPEIIARAKDISLVVVGSGERAWLKPYEGMEGVEVVGRVDKLSSYYEDCIATIVPVFYGSGTRVKAIESSLHGRACLSTEVGVEGMGLTPGEHYYRVETAKEWIDTIVSLDKIKVLKMGESARKYARTAFDPGTIAERFIDCVSRG